MGTFCADAEYAFFRCNELIPARVDEKYHNWCACRIPAGPALSYTDPPGISYDGNPNDINSRIR
jgi:hypothetical protein